MTRPLDQLRQQDTRATGSAPEVLPGVGLAPDSQLTTRQQMILSVLFALTAVIACLVFEPWSVRFVSRDSTEFLYLAERVARGVPPYVSAFSPQNALSVMIQGGGISLGSNLGWGVVASSRILSIALFAVTVSGLGLFTYRMTRNLLAASLTVLALLSFTWLVLMATTSSQPKVVAMFFVVVTMLATERRKWILAGAAAAAAFLSYQALLVLLPAVALAALPGSHKLPRMARIVGAFASVWLLYEGYFFWYHALPAQIDEAFVFAGQTRKGLFDNPIRNMRFALAFWEFGGGRFNALPILAVGTAGVWLASLLRRPIGLVRSMADRPGWILVQFCCYPLALYTLMDLQGAADLITIAPVAAIMTGIGGAGVVGWLAGKKLGLRPLATVLGLAVPLLLIGHDYRRMRNFLGSTDLSDQYALAERVRSWSDHGATILCLGPTHLLAFNHTANWSIYSNSYAVRPKVGYYEYRNGPGEFVPESDGELPDFIIWSAGMPRGWPEWLEQHYSKVTLPAFADQGIGVWYHDSDSQPAPGRPTS